MVVRREEREVELGWEVRAKGIRKEQVRKCTWERTRMKRQGGQVRRECGMRSG